jgi:hypothetical protein
MEEIEILSKSFQMKIITNIEEIKKEEIKIINEIKSKKINNIEYIYFWNDFSEYNTIFLKGPTG